MSYSPAEENPIRNFSLHSLFSSYSSSSGSPNLLSSGAPPLPFFSSSLNSYSISILLIPPILLFLIRSSSVYFQLPRSPSHPILFILSISFSSTPPSPPILLIFFPLSSFSSSSDLSSSSSPLFAPLFLPILQEPSASKSKS